MRRLGGGEQVALGEVAAEPASNCHCSLVSTPSATTVEPESSRHADDRLDEVPVAGWRSRRLMNERSILSFVDGRSCR